MQGVGTSRSRNMSGIHEVLNNAGWEEGKGFESSRQNSSVWPLLCSKIELNWLFFIYSRTNKKIDVYSIRQKTADWNAANYMLKCAFLIRQIKVEIKRLFFSPD